MAFMGLYEFCSVKLYIVAEGKVNNAGRNPHAQNNFLLINLPWVSFLISSGSAQSCRCYFWGWLGEGLWVFSNTWMFLLNAASRVWQPEVAETDWHKRVTVASASSPTPTVPPLIVTLQAPLVCQHVYDSGFSVLTHLSITGRKEKQFANGRRKDSTK